jgi:CubicO group peptidase (beta-lactamase class C family)
MKIDSIHKMMKKGLFETVFPGAVLLITSRKEIQFFEAYGFANIFCKRPMTRDTLFDLASLTKPLATTLALMGLVHEGKISLDHQIGKIFSVLQNTPKANITIRNLLLHNSGLTDYRPYFKRLFTAKPSERRNLLRRMLIEETLQNTIGERVCYSDVGFMFLQWIIESVTDLTLDQIVSKKIYGPLGLKYLGFAEDWLKKTSKPIAATEWCRFRGGVIEGRVHDENADALGGIAGHAGLFGNALELNRLLTEIYKAYVGRHDGAVFSTRLIKQFLHPHPATGRALGFDIPSTNGSSSGKWFATKSVGHLGFTGVSFWMDLEREIWIILLTNRVHPDRRNERIKQFRPVLHDLIMETFL